MLPEILIPVGILFGVALVCAVLLTVANKYFGIKEDETAVAIRDCLPGANCGACGYSGCDGYAKALADGLKATDTAASAIAMSQKINMYVFPLNELENIVKAVSGEEIGTLVTFDSTAEAILY